MKKKLQNPVYVYNNLTTKKRGKAFFAGISKMIRRGDRVFVYRRKRVDIGKKIVQIAAKYVGTVEQPPNSNSGDRVEEFQAATTVAGTGWPWCQAFVRFVLDKAGAQKNGYRGAYVPNFETWAKAAGLWTQKPKAGYAVVFEFTGDDESDHVGIFVAMGVNVVHTIEGNTSRDFLGSQSNGGGVFRRSRNHYQIKGYIKTY